MSGALSVVQKPFVMDVLHKTLDGILNNTQA